MMGRVRLGSSTISTLGGLLRRIPLVALILLLGCAEEGSQTGVCEPGLTLAGDSLTAAPGWADLVIEMYEPGYARRAALGALTTSAFLPGATLARRFDIRTCEVVILLGTNDVMRGVGWRDYLQNIESITNDLIHNRGTERIVIMTPPPLFFEPRVYSDAFNRRLADYRSALFDLCEKDMEDEIECGPDLYLEMNSFYFDPDDGIHFNIHGHAYVYQRIVEFLPPVP